MLIIPDELKENTDVRQRPQEGWRRWFVNAYFELIVWYESEAGPLVGFQLCLSRNQRERAFTWTTDYVSSHIVSDSFLEKGISKMATGILRGDGGKISEEEIRKFEAESWAIDPDLRTLVLEKIRANNGARSGP